MAEFKNSRKYQAYFHVMSMFSLTELEGKLNVTF